MKPAKLRINGEPANHEFVWGIRRKEPGSTGGLAVEVQDGMESVGVCAVKFELAVKSLFLDKNGLADVVGILGESLREGERVLQETSSFPKK